MTEVADRSAKPRLRLGRVIGPTIGLLLLATVAVLFAPTAVGGRASYVVTQGTSMLPHFRADGLVMTRAQSQYHVGDVVAYRNRQLHSVVMHRIVARDGSRFVMKGDNNNFRDSYHPAQSDFVGAEWVYWPNGGRLTRSVRTPLFFALMLAALGWFAGNGISPTSARETRHAH